MTIIKKDGNVYTLSVPNKLAKSQVAWDISKLVFHNFTWKEEVFNFNKSSKNSKKNPEILKTKPQEIKPEETPEIKLEEIPKETHEEIHENKEEKVDFDLPFIKYKVLIHCLPAQNKNYSDSFYVENWSKITYKKKFIFPAIIISNEDLILEFWSTDPENKITEKSIIFPFAYEVYNEESLSYDRVPYDQHRWWLISSKERKESGWLFSAIPSADQPDFSD